MFVRYLIADGKCPAGLEQAVPGVAGWQLSWLPKTLPTADVERVLAACDTSTQKGLRDRALLLLLVRLGLRAQDIIRLRIADIDWAGATLRVSGKGRSEARVPLTQEVGDAILAYLEYGRPRVTDPHLFLRDVAPIGPWATSQRVSLLVRRAIRRSGVVAPSYGAHMLRHSAATEMLRQGASLYEISAMLRHRSIATTAVYAKVDVASLKLVAQPWPEVQ
jgi:site-specific recombinase XerD